VYLTQGKLKVTTSPLTITGGVSIEGGPPLSLPGLGSVTAIKGQGQFTFSTANGWDLDVNGQLALAGMAMNQGGAQADIDVNSAKGVTFSGSINVNNAAVKFTAALNGDISGNGFYVGANVNITLPWLNNFTAGAAVGIGSGG